MLCIIANTISLAAYQTIDPDLDNILNVTFAVTFAVEALIKLCALTIPGYFEEGKNIFDFVIAAFGVIDLVVTPFVTRYGTL